MAIAGSRLAARVTHRFRRHVAEATDAMGGRARARSIVLLASALALDAADKGAVGAVAVQLEHGLHVGNTDIGLMVTVSSLVGAACTVPIGALTDRYRRSRLLWMSILLWAAAEAAGGLSPSFTVLIATRVALGAVTGTAGPTVASLTGDLFEPGERSRMYGFILTGEFVGTGIGVLIAEAAVGPFGWRASFITLAFPSLFLAWAIRRWLPEPERGASTRQAIDRPEANEGRDLVIDLVKEREVPPDEGTVVPDTGEEMSLWQAVRYVLRVRTNLILIAASSLGYFFFSGLRTFAVIFVRGRYHTGQGGATAILLAVGVGAFAGLLIAGQSGDALLRRGHLSGRITVGAVAYVAAAGFLLPGLL